MVCQASISQPGGKLLLIARPAWLLTSGSFDRTENILSGCAGQLQQPICWPVLPCPLLLVMQAFDCACVGRAFCLAKYCEEIYDFRVWLIPVPCTATSSSCDKIRMADGACFFVPWRMFSKPERFWSAKIYKNQKILLLGIQRCCCVAQQSNCESFSSMKRFFQKKPCGCKNIRCLAQIH